MLLLLAPVSASHSVSLEVNNPNGFYISSKDTVTFTATNTGRDTAYVSCGGVGVWQQAVGQQNMVAQETNSCYVLQGAAVAISYEIQAGQQHVWQWDQTYQNSANQNINGLQVPNGKYFGEIVTYTDLKTGASLTHKSSDFNIDSDADGDGVADGADACPNDAKNQCNQPDADNDGVTDKLDPCPQDSKDSCADGDPDKDGIKNYEDECDNEAGPSNTKGCPDSDSDGIADKNDSCITEKEDENGFKDGDGCPDGAQKDAHDTACKIAAGAAAAAVIFTFLALGSGPFGAMAFGVLAVGATVVAGVAGYLCIL